MTSSGRKVPDQRERSARGERGENRRLPAFDLETFDLGLVGRRATAPGSAQRGAGRGLEARLAAMDLGREAVLAEFGDHLVDVALPDVMGLRVGAQLAPILGQDALASGDAGLAHFGDLLEERLDAFGAERAGLGFAAHGR